MIQPDSPTAAVLRMTLSTSVERVGVGGILSPGFNVSPNNLLGDGVNAPDVPPQETFPYIHYAYSGRDSRHISPG